MELSRKRKEISRAQKKLLRKLMDGNDSEMGLCCTCKDVSLLNVEDEWKGE